MHHLVGVSDLGLRVWGLGFGMHHLVRVLREERTASGIAHNLHRLAEALCEEDSNVGVSRLSIKGLDLAVDVRVDHGNRHCVELLG